MPLGFIDLQYLFYLQVKAPVAKPQPLCQILVHRRFGNTELLGGGSDGGAVFDDVHGQIAGPLFHVVCQKATLPAHRSMSMYAATVNDMQPLTKAMIFATLFVPQTMAKPDKISGLPRFLIRFF